MYLSRLFIQNYRSIKELDLQFSKGKNVIVGKNNTGKSNIVRALDVVLGEYKPTYSKSENVTEKDFYSYKAIENGIEVNKVANELLIWCELIRDPGEQLNYAEINKCYGYYVYRVKRVPHGILPNKASVLFKLKEDGVNKDKKQYINPKLLNQGSYKNELEAKYRFAFAFQASRNAEGEITREIRFLYRENDQSDWHLAFKDSIRTELLQSAIIPSFRNPEVYLRLTSWSWFGKLMRHLIDKKGVPSKLIEAFGKVKDAADEIFENVRASISNSTLRIAFPGTSLSFQFNPDSKVDLYKNCHIYVDDGFNSLLADKGSGIQSAVIIGLFSYYTRFVNTTTAALLCVEEPELFLHPHARRVISDRLDDFLEGTRNQVILTTHSPEFLRSASGDLNIIMVRKNGEGTQAKPISLKDFGGILINNNQNEIFFADKAILVEGLDEFVVRMMSRELYPGKIDEQNVSVIQVGDKDRFAKMAKIITHLGIETYLLCDFDYLLRDEMEERKQYGKDVKAHGSLADLPLSFYNQQHLFGSDAEQVLSEIRALRQQVKQSSPEFFYTGKRLNEAADKSVFEPLLVKLRSKGVGILDGELEDCVTNRDFLPERKKIDLKKIYLLNRHLSEGGKISDIFDCKQISALLQLVLTVKENDNSAIQCSSLKLDVSNLVVPDEDSTPTH